jgi:GT2 family glycosyltransferase
MTFLSILTAATDISAAAMTQTIESVQAQTHIDWEWCIVDDAYDGPAMRRLLTETARHDSRIRVYRRPQRGGPARAFQDALEISYGAAICVLEQGDLLHPEALATVDRVFDDRPDVDVVYTDEDTVTESGRHIEPFHKPGWSPDLLSGCMYLRHLTAYRASLARAAGGFRPEFDGAHDWDLALRATPRARLVWHVPEVLYHRRAEPGLPYATVEPEAGRRALADRLASAHVDATVEDADRQGYFRVRRRLAQQDRVGVVIPTAGTRAEDDGERLIDQCLTGLLERTDPPDTQILVVVSANAPEGLEDELRGFGGGDVHAVRVDGTFNYSRSVNTGALLTTTPYILLLNDDTEPLAADWLRRMVELASDPMVGVVGTRLLFPQGAVQHAGVTHSPDGLPYHPHAWRAEDAGQLDGARLRLNYLAVTGACQLMRREVFERVGGYDTRLPLNYNDIDFCLKVGTQGLRIVQANDVRLIHHESMTRPRGVNSVEQFAFLDRWKHQTLQDPYERSAATAPRR